MALAMKHNPLTIAVEGAEVRTKLFLPDPQMPTMAMMIVYTSAGMRLLRWLLTRGLARALTGALPGHHESDTAGGGKSSGSK